MMCLGSHISSISQIVFFLLGALAIVEIISVHQGFAVIADNIRVMSKKRLLWVMGFIAFFLSSVLDNLTTTIVMVTVLKKLIDESEDRLIIGAGVVIAANAGGAWTPIGDVTTTMLWIGGQVSTFNIMYELLLPSLACLVVSLVCLGFFLRGDFPSRSVHEVPKTLEPMGGLVFCLGVAALIFVPVFKVLTGLPPFMGMFFGLSILWIVTDLVHRNHDGREHLRMTQVFTKIDLSSLLFFVGILLAIDALDAAKILEVLASTLQRTIGNDTIIVTVIGLASAVVDNVPLVAASMGMYPLTQHPVDSNFWNLIAYCAGTGGSILIIGSAAGVVFMGMEKVNFMWYVKKVSLAALVGYFAGIFVYLIYA
jgi:Na+/H+ antiporter NhaD/arsenite permease-like protein